MLKSVGCLRETKRVMLRTEALVSRDARGDGDAWGVVGYKRGRDSRAVFPCHVIDSCLVPSCLNLGEATVTKLICAAASERVVIGGSLSMGRKRDGRSSRLFPLAARRRPLSRRCRSSAATSAWHSVKHRARFLCAWHKSSPHSLASLERYFDGAHFLWPVGGVRCPLTTSPVLVWPANLADCYLAWRRRERGSSHSRLLCPMIFARLIPGGDQGRIAQVCACGAGGVLPCLAHADAHYAVRHWNLGKLPCCHAMLAMLCHAPRCTAVYTSTAAVKTCSDRASHMSTSASRRWWLLLSTQADSNGRASFACSLGSPCWAAVFHAAIWVGISFELASFAHGGRGAARWIQQRRRRGIIRLLL